MLSNVTAKTYLY